MDIKPFEHFAIETAKSAGEVLMSYFGKLTHVDNKSTDIDLVTHADIDSERLIIQAIQSEFPHHNIIAEESDFDKIDSDYCWVVDPLDGTTNFVHTLPIFAVSIGLRYKNKTILGVVYNPVYNQCFHATLNGGAFLNNSLINKSSTNTLSESLLVTGFPYIHDDRWQASFKLFEDFYSRNQGMRRLGAAALDFCFVAMGRFDGFYEFNLQPWDVCAGDLILREAGGQTSDWDGITQMPLSGNRILASNGYLQSQMSEVLMQKKYIDVFFRLK
jgi:myo-inositol-1(or 4)-monophosphatase